MHKHAIFKSLYNSNTEKQKTVYKIAKVAK